MEKNRIVIIMEGGLVQHVMASSADLDVYLIDYDTEGAADTDLADIPQGDGVTIKAYVSRPWVGVDEQRTEELIQAIAGNLSADSMTTVREIGTPGSGNGSTA